MQHVTVICFYVYEIDVTKSYVNSTFLFKILKVIENVIKANLNMQLIKWVYKICSFLGFNSLKNNYYMEINRLTESTICFLF